VLGVGAEALLSGGGWRPAVPRDGPLPGALFESLVTLGDDLLDAAINTTGTHAYRRSDSIAMIPAAFLGP
jgi:hypothetical protein